MATERATARRARWQGRTFVGVALVGGCATGGSAREGPGPASSSGPGATATTTEEIPVPADGLDLVGTLERPDTPGPHPTVVIVHGSGPSDQDGTARGQLGMQLPAPVPIYAEQAAGLAVAGCATIRWDKRTCGPSNACGTNDSTHRMGGRSRATT